MTPDAPVNVEPPTEAKILHISDLHFGPEFDADSWTNLVDRGKALQPNLVIVTGDLVDNPTRWSLNRAAVALTKLEQDLNCKVIVVPGNHDTRVLGLLPIKWLNPIIITVLVILSLSLLLFGWPSSILMMILLGVGLLLSAILITLRVACLDFNKRFEKFIIPSPHVYSAFGMEIFGFDSATRSVFGARGRIPKKQFVDVQSRSQKPEAISGNVGNGYLPYRIAILHHHPLPIPYDDSNEYLMVADNAGAFLSEVSDLRIRLVLHGHKHRSHFSRVTINAGEEKEHELAVLAVGTLSRSGSMDPPEHHFYLLRLDAIGNMEVTRFVAKPGGAFKEGKPFYIESSALASKRYYEAAVGARHITCDSTVITAELTADGDLDYRHEFHGFHLEKGAQPVQGLPCPTEVQAGTGHIDDFGAGDLEADSTEHITMKDEILKLTHRKGRVLFGREMKSGNQALNFYTHYVALNAFAMSRQQHEQMYSETDSEVSAGKTRKELLSMQLQDIPTERFDFVVKFPAGFQISGKPNLVIKRNKSDERDDASELRLRHHLKYYPHLNVVMARIPYPRLDLTYELHWVLSNAPPPSGNPSVSLIGKVETLAMRLLQISSDDPQHKELEILLKTIEEKVRSDFGLEDQQKDPLDVSLMAYDKTDHVLKIVAANFTLDQPMMDFKLRYGDGIAGRAYKMNKGRMFIKNSAIDKHTPNYFYPVDGRPCRLEEIPETVVISFPLRHPENESLTYGILNLSSKNSGSRLQDIKEPRVLNELSEFRASVNLACYEALENRIFNRVVEPLSST